MKKSLILSAVLCTLVACDDSPKQVAPKYNSETLKPATKPPVKIAIKPNETQAPKRQVATDAVRPNSGNVEITPEQQRELAIQQAAEVIVAERLAEEKRLIEEAKKRTAAEEIQMAAEKLATQKLAEIKLAQKLSEESQQADEALPLSDDPDQAAFEQAIKEGIAKQDAISNKKAAQVLLAKQFAEQQVALKATQQRASQVLLAQEFALQQAALKRETQLKAAAEQVALYSEQDVALPPLAPEETSTNEAQAKVEEPEYIWVEGIGVNQSQNQNISTQKPLNEVVKDLGKNLGDLERTFQNGDIKNVDLNKLASQLDGLTQQAGQIVQSGELNDSLNGIANAFGQATQNGIQEVDFKDLGNALEGFSNDAQEVNQASQAIQNAFQEGYNQGQ